MCPWNTQFSQQYEGPNGRFPFGPVHIFSVAPVACWVLFSQVFGDGTPRCDCVKGRRDFGIGLGSSENVLERQYRTPGLSFFRSQSTVRSNFAISTVLDNTLKLQLGTVGVPPIKANPTESYWN